jgi:hypothetical protein
VVERGGLENRCACKRTVGSNPTPSAIRLRFFEATAGNSRLNLEEGFPPYPGFNPGEDGWNRTY